MLYRIIYTEATPDRIHIYIPYMSAENLQKNISANANMPVFFKLLSKKPAENVLNHIYKHMFC